MLIPAGVHRMQRVFGRNTTFRKIFFFAYSCTPRCETSNSICTSEFCSNNGICYIDASSGNSTLRCICSQSYTGSNCQSPINVLNPCQRNPCGNNGTCITTTNSSYTCLCPNGLIAQSCSSSRSHDETKNKDQLFSFRDF